MGNSEVTEILKDTQTLLNKLLALNDKDLKYGWIFPMRKRIDKVLNVDKLNE